MAANDAVSMNVAENRQNVPMAIQENRAAVPMTVAEGGGTPGGLNRKADKVTGAAAGNLAGLDSTGNLTDSGKAPEDFLEAPASAGTQGQVLTADGEGGASWQDPTGGDPTEIIDDEAGSGDTDKVWSADKSHELLTEINSKYEKPNTGIPSSDMSSAVQASLENADSAYQKPQTGIPASDMAEGVIPDISGKADKTVTDDLQKNKAPVIIDSAEGNPIVLTDGTDGLPVESMKIHFLPKQDTSGGDPSPSNICPISGRTGITAYRTGVNVWDEELEIGTIDTSGQPLYDPYFIRSKNFIPVLPNMSYFVKTGTSQQRVFFYDKDKTFISFDYSSNGDGKVYTTPDDCYFVKFRPESTYGTTYNNDIFINYPSTDTDYHPYTGQSYPVTFPDGQTVYGGCYDAVTGVLMVNWGSVLLNGSEGWDLANGVFYAPLTGYARIGGQAVISDKLKGLADIANTTAMSSKDDNSIATQFNISYNRMFIKKTDCADVSALETWLENNPVTLVYILATPVEIPLSAISVTTLLGDNTIWSDANGQIDLEYRADTKLWISGHSITVDSALSDTSENPVQNKVIKTALDGKEPLHNTTTVSGATPTITGVADTRYICGECSTLTITAPASGCIDVLFESGSTPTVLTVTSAKTGVSAIRWANGFDPTALEANTTYEINILDGEFGVVGKWT